MRIAFLFFLFATVAHDQVPVVSNYEDFLIGVQDGQATALSLDVESFQYGVQVNHLIYLEIMPLNEEYQLLFSEIYEEPIADKRVQETSFPKGDSYVCLCQKKDLVELLKRWKDGQHSMRDYAKFDCKHKSFSKKENLYKGQSFWADIKPLESLAQKVKKVEHIALSENVSAIVFKNRGDQSKKVIRIGFGVPVEDVVKTLEEETHLTSVKNSKGEELYRKEIPAMGWKSLFPDWKAYRPLNTGFWGEPTVKNPITEGYFSKSYSIAATKSNSFDIQGQATFLVKGKSKKQKMIELNLGEHQRIIKKEAYLDYGSDITYGVAGVDTNSQQLAVSFTSEIPILGITVLDEKGVELGRTVAAPFEVLVPLHTTHIFVKIEYSNLKKVQVDYQVN